MKKPFIDQSREARWRLILGKDADHDLPLGGEGQSLAMDESLDLLYDEDRQGQLGDSMPRLHRWMGEIRDHFPPGALHLMQRDAFDRLGLAEMLLEPEMLERLEPDLHLAGVLMAHFRQLDEKRREAARQVIRQITDQLIRQLQLPMLQALRGGRKSHGRRRNPPWPAIDWNLTIRRNLKHYQQELGTLIPEERLGYRNRQPRQKELVIVVDQSASMSDSLIYSGIYANVLAQLPRLHLTLLAFDVRVLDLSDLVHDPVDLLLGFQLGGGTDIANALGAARKAIRSPTDAVVVLISDLQEGDGGTQMMAEARAILATGSRMICLLTLSTEGRPSFDEAIAERMRKLGIPSFACSPELFPEVMSKAFAGGLTELVR